MNAALLDLHRMAGGHGDAHLADFLEENFLGEQAHEFPMMLLLSSSFLGGEHQRDRRFGDEDEEGRRRNRVARH